MTTYYVGTGGNNGSNGLSWANRKLTLNGAEDIPLVAGDTVYVGPGVYRELLTLDVSGSSGNPITYIGDVSGINTDGIGGTVRVTGTDNEQTKARAACVTGTSRSFRTFRGFSFDSTSGINFTCPTASTDYIVEYCSFHGSDNTAMQFTGPTNISVKNCLIFGCVGPGIIFTSTGTTNDKNCIVENCIFIQGNQVGVQSVRVGGVFVYSSLFIGCSVGARVNTALAAGQVMTVNGCNFYACPTGVSATVTGELVENYNNFNCCGTLRTNVSVGANSLAYPFVFDMPFQLAGYKMPWFPGELSEWSLLSALTHPVPSSVDFFGTTRTTTSNKTTWGAIQYQKLARETGTVLAGSVSLALNDASRLQFVVPTTAVSTTISVKVRREADYTGTLPQMIIKQPGQSDRTTTAAAAVNTTETLTDTFTPSALTDFVVVELVSHNTAAATNFKVFFDDLDVTP
jgi:hypothetical protein